MNSKELAQYLDVKPNTLLLYGYTFDREDVFVYFDEDFYLCKDTGSPFDVFKFYDEPTYLYNACILNVKRYFSNCVNQKLKELFEKFGVPLPVLNNQDANRYRVGMEL